MKQIIIGKYNEDGSIESLITELVKKEEKLVLNRDEFNYSETQISDDLQSKQK